MRDNLPPCPPENNDNKNQKKSTPKWRICQNFSEVNHTSQIPPTLQGDIRTKQQHLSGHRWISIIDFAAGFYTIPVDPESEPYLAFFMEGWGYDCYCHIPFGLTGAPTHFRDMAAVALWDLIGLLFELYVDDTGMVGDVFKEKLSRLCSFFKWVQDMWLSLSPSKIQLFMTEVIFAGAWVGHDSIKPDLAKISTVVDWVVPSTVHDLMQFLGLMGYFRSLVKDYAWRAAPLMDLIWKLGTPPGGQHVGRHKYRQHLYYMQLGPHWGLCYTEAFMDLK